MARSCVIAEAVTAITGTARVAGSARSLSALVAGVLPAPAAEGPVQMDTLRGGAVSVEATFTRVARILSGRSAEAALAPLVAARRATSVPTLETTAQQRARVAFEHVLRTPKEVRGFLQVVAAAQQRALVARPTAQDLRRRGRDLLRGTKGLRRELRRLQAVSRSFAR